LLLAFCKLTGNTSFFVSLIFMQLVLFFTEAKLGYLMPGTVLLMYKIYEQKGYLVNRKNKFLIYILAAALIISMFSALSCSKTANNDLISTSTAAAESTSAAETKVSAETDAAKTTMAVETTASTENTATTGTTAVPDSTVAETTKVEKKELILASTTSTDDSGLFGELLPDFEKATGYKVKLIAVGS
jgi:hypothetical protein